jgi:hypothetical protein
MILTWIEKNVGDVSQKDDFTSWCIKLLGVGRGSTLCVFQLICGLCNSSRGRPRMIGLVGDFMILKEIIHRRSPIETLIGIVFEMIRPDETSWPSTIVTDTSATWMRGIWCHKAKSLSMLLEFAPKSISAFETNDSWDVWRSSTCTIKHHETW